MAHNIIHFQIWETIAYIFQYTAKYAFHITYLETKTKIALHVIFTKFYPLLCTYIAHTCLYLNVNVCTHIYSILCTH